MSRPAVTFVVPLIAGIVTGWYFYIPTAILLTASTSLFLSVILSNRGRPGYSALLVILVFVAGALKITLDKDLSGRDRLSQFLRLSKIVAVRGIVTDPPRSTTVSIQFVVDGKSIIDGGRVHPISGGVLVSARIDENALRLADSLRYGADVICYGRITYPGTARNPGEFDLRNYLQLQGIYARCYLNESSDAVVVGKSGNWFLSEIVYPLRRSIGQSLDGLIGGEEARFLKGLTIGDRSGISPEVKTSFINSGVMHILAVSGLHVILVVTILVSVIGAFRVPEPWKTILLCLLLVFYIFLTGSSASVVRAVVMAIVVLGGRLFERKSDVINSLAVSAIVILMVDARQLFMPGFQLTFMAVLSIVILYPRFYSFISTLTAKHVKHRLIDRIIQLACLSLAASVGTLPFTVHYFGKIPLVGLLANLVVVPMSDIILASGMTTIVASFISTAIASLYAEAARVSTMIMLAVVKWFGSFSYIEWHISQWQVIGYYALLVALLQWKKFLTRRTIIGGLLIANVAVYLSVFGFRSQSPLRVTFLDVGQGDAAFVEFPDGKTMLVDAGPRTMTSDAGVRFVLPFLRWKGVSRLDAIVLSHPHSDHLGGVPAILRGVSVGEIVDVQSTSRSQLYGEYGHLIDSLNIPHVQLKAGDMISGFSLVRTYVVHPSAAFIVADLARSVNLNNQSLVVRIVYGSTSVLFAGDAEEEAEESMTGRYAGFLRSDLLKVGHHGSNTSSSEVFLDAVKPLFGVLSVGKNNAFHHPSSVTLRHLAERRVQTFRTDEQNAIVFVSDGVRWRQEQWR